MKKNILPFLLCIIFLLFAMQGFRYVMWSSLFPSHFFDFFYLGVIFFGFILFQYLRLENIWNGNYLKWLIILPLISEVIKLLLTGHFALSELAPTLALCGGLSTFYFMHKFKINVNVIFYAILVLASIAFVIQYGENYLNFPTFFGVADIDEKLRSRYDTGFDILSIHVCAQLIPVFCVYYFWCKFILNGRWQYLLPMAVFLVFLYLLQNRQTMIAVALSMMFTPMINGTRGTIRYSILGAVTFLAFAYFYREQLFGSIIESSIDNTESWDVRMLELPLFIRKSIENPVVFLFGHGYQSDVFLINGYPMYTSDVGFIGWLYNYGIIFVVLYFKFLYRVYKERQSLPLLFKLYVFSSTVHSLFIPPYSSAVTGFLWATMIYYVSYYKRMQVSYQ